MKLVWFLLAVLCGALGAGLLLSALEQLVFRGEAYPGQALLGLLFGWAAWGSVTRLRG